MVSSPPELRAMARSSARRASVDSAESELRSPSRIAARLNSAFELNPSTSIAARSPAAKSAGTGTLQVSLAERRFFLALQQAVSPHLHVCPEVRVADLTLCPSTPARWHSVPRGAWHRAHYRPEIPLIRIMPAVTPRHARPDARVDPCAIRVLDPVLTAR